MNRREKEALVSELKARLDRAQACFLVECQGLSVETMSTLRRELRKSSAEFQVVKNRLLRLASRGTGTEVMEKHFVGQCGVAIASGDVIAPAKVLVEQSKKFERLKVKAGQVGGRLVPQMDVKRLAELPGRGVLLAQALSAMQAVPSSFVRALNGIILNLCYVLKAIEEQKSKSGLVEKS